MFVLLAPLGAGELIDLAWRTVNVITRRQSGPAWCGSLLATERRLVLRGRLVILVVNEH